MRKPIGQMSYKCTPEIEKEKEIDIELKKDILSNTVSFKLYNKRIQVLSTERSVD
ncbi:hypothetical protein [Vagococcus lutrae]|uniref:hypothetical protein n=1 Tax=Vagococcus lutrae TaxID=81947 RepID=UPI002891C1AC|nr:hypothetical protein [Vagococcus lutrae]MDT2842939.1 hypothetical protein [Vagococcus lutrae]